ncbi:MAG: choice-of-anchor D domain-containing protein [Alphaproteobacteria bacterium]|nr:choice-of-anchor D domain-containing protein [Alphaproteobacteria bacterium]
MTFFAKAGRYVLLTALVVAAASPAFARDAAFMAPGAGGVNADEAVRVDPKPEIDIGDTAIGVTKRTTIFFVNQTDQPVRIEKVTTNSDANVAAEITGDDCMKHDVLASASRCSVEVSVTPSSPGDWGVDVLMTHSGAGRIARAHLKGKTSGSASRGEKSTGLAVSDKKVAPIDFGSVTVGDGKIVRSTLLVNDSSDPITIYSIDVIEAGNGLQRLDQGCEVDMELAPGSSCPVTLLWEPKEEGPVSTDLIIRHSGKMGFAVIPIRGEAKNAGGSETASGKGGVAASSTRNGVPPPPSARELEREMKGHIAPISSAALSPGGGSDNMGGSGSSNGDGKLHLIGTVGERALFLKPDGETAIVAVGDAFDENGKSAKLISITFHSATVSIDGKKRSLPLEAAQSLVSQARAAASEEQASESSSSSGRAAPRTVKLPSGGSGGGSLK